jgi:hypothetical protein
MAWSCDIPALLLRDYDKWGVRGRRQLTPLHVAVVRDDLEDVQRLFEEGVYINARDAMGWTPAHHAAVMGHRRIFQWLASHGADLRLRNHRGGTPLDLWRIVAPPRPGLAVIDEEGVRVCRPPGNFTFVQEVTSTPHYVHEDWWVASADCEEEENPSGLRTRYEAYRRNPPRLYLSTSQCDDRGAPIPPIGWRTFAGQAIAAGTIVTEYTGRYLWKQQSRSAYVLGEIDGAEVGGYASRISDGFPNLSVVALYHVRGVQQRMLLVAVSDIREGEELTFNYGLSHSVKWEHVELKPSAVEAFVVSGGIQEALAALHGPYEESVHRQALVEKLCYLICTPSTLRPFSSQVDLRALRSIPFTPGSPFLALYGPEELHAWQAHWDACLSVE